MAYGLKYTAPYRTVEGLVKVIKFYKVGYTGVVTEWKSTLAGVQYEYGSSDSLFGKPIVPSQAKVGFIFEQQYDLSEFVYDRKTFFCEVVLVSSGKVEWSGWVEPWDAQHDYVLPAYAVSLTVSCGLAHLAKQKYVNPNNNFKKTGLDIIQECLAIIGSTLYLRTSTHMKENAFPEDWLFGLRSFEINTARYYDTNGEAMYCDQIISDILNKFNAEILQWDNRWVIRSIVDHATGYERSFYEYPFEGGGDSPSSSWPGTYIINDTKALTLEGGQLSILPPINKYRTEVDLGSQVPFFENGNMVLWNDNGLVGWDFTHMAKGDPGWERFFLGQEGSTASVLKINGKAPGPYEKKRKKKFWQVAIPILTGAVGANLKNKYDDIEPTEWIESPVGKISRGDKNITVSFEYETAPNSSDVLISIRLRSSWKTPLLQRWLNFGVGDSQTQDTFHLIRVAPAEREGLLYVGAIDVSGNPNYPHGAVINYTFIAKGVPLGEVRRIGGPSGIIVENDDLIIVKSTNPGGTQATVGNDWMVINIRNNVKKGTYSVTIPVDRNNIVSASHVNDPLLFDEVLVRFYKVADENNGLGDWYKIYNLNGVLEGFVASDESSQYATTLERGAPTDEEAETINLITGDYNPYFSGSLTKPGSNENTKSWSRRPDPIESLSVYRAMMLDRLCLTTRPLTVFEGDIKLLPGQSNLSYLHTLVMSDMDNMRMRIVRYSFEDYRRIAKITAIEVKYEEIPATELRQDSYIPGQGSLNVIPGQGDGYYPTKTDSTNGRISAEDLPPTPEELEDLTLATASSRQGVVFSEIDPLVFVVGNQGTESVDLIDYVSQQFQELNDDQEDEDKFDLTTLALSVIDKPTWVSAISFDNLEVSVTAKAPTSGDYYITLNAFEPVSETNIEFRLPIQAINKTVITTNLVDASGGTAIGSLPGFYLNPEKIDIWPRVKGNHNLVVLDLIGGGMTGTPAINEHREFPTNYLVVDFTYKMFLAESGIAAQVGKYNFRTRTYFEGALRSDTTIPFTLYDEEYLSKASFELWDNTNDALLGVINPDGSSVFKKPASFEIKISLTDLLNDKSSFTLLQEGIDIFERDFTQTAVEDVSYELFGEIKPFGPAKYELVMKNSLLTNQIYQRNITFEIQEEPPKPEAGIDLIVFRQNTVNYDIVENLPLVGLQLDLPDNYGFSIPVPAVDYDSMDYSLYDKTTGALVNYDIQLRTGVPQSRTYLEGQEKEPVLIFGLKNSTEFPGLHRAPSSLRVVATFRKDGEVVAIRQGEVSFRIPLEPGDYSGTRFITFSGTDITVVDANMPKSGGQYILPLPDKYSIAVRDIDGLLFKSVKVQYYKMIAGAYLMLILHDDYVVFYEEPTEVIELSSDSLANVIGIGTPRYMYAPDGAHVIIDEVGEYKAVFTFYGELSGVVGVKETEFSIIDSEPEELPIEDCCGGSSGSADLPVYEGVAGQYGDKFKTLKVTLTENGTVSEIEEIDIEIPGDEIVGLVHNFDHAPKIIAPSTDLDAAATVGQLLQYTATGAYPRTPVKTVSVTNIALSGLQTINGYTGTAGDRILLTGQTDAKENGAYVMTSGSWSRAADSNTGDELLGAEYFIETGNEAGSTWKVTNPAPIVIGTTLITIIKTRTNTSDLRWIANPAELGDLNLVRKGGVKTWGGSTLNSPYGPGGTALTFVGNTDTGDGNSNQSWINQLLAATNGELYWRQSLNNWNVWTPAYKFWTESHFSATDISHWNLAYGWGNHANAGYLLTADFLSTFNSVVPKGDIVAGSSKLTLSGSGVGRLIGTGNLTINVGALSIYDITSLPGLLNAKADISVTNDLQLQLYSKSNVGHTHALSELTGAADIQAIELLSGVGVPKKLGEGSWQMGLLSIYDIDGLPGTLNSKADKTTTNDLQTQINSITTGGITGPGTVGYLPKYGTSKGLVNSIISETSGAINVAGALAATSLESNAAPSNANVIGFNFTNAGSLRWVIGKYGVEGSGNSGSDLYFSRLSNTGAFLGNALIINRATGAATFSAELSVPTPTLGQSATNKTYVDNLLADKENSFSKGNILGSSKILLTGTGTGRLYGLGDLTLTLGVLAISDITSLTGTLNGKADVTVTNDLQSQINSITTGGVTGSGTAGYFPKFSASKVLTNSIVSENSGLISVAGNLRALTFESNAAPSSSSVLGFTFSNAGSNRWQFGKYGTEGTGNSGSDLYLSRFANDGSFLGNAIYMERATGLVTFYNQLTISGSTSVAPFAVNSAVLVTNLNADFLDGQHGSYYMNRANQTGQITIYDVTSLPGILNAKAETTVTNDLQAQINGKASTSHTHALTAITGAADVNAIEILTGTGVLKRTGDNAWSLGLISIYDVTDLAGILNAKASTDTTNALQAALNGKSDVNHVHNLAQIVDAYDLKVIEALTGSGVLKRNGDSNWSVGPISISDVNSLTGTLNAKAETSVTNDLQAQINNRATIATTNDLQGQINGKLDIGKYITVNGGLQYLNNNPNFTVGTVTGSGSGNYLTRYTANGTNIGNSRIYDSGSGLMSMDAGFNVNGLVNVSGTLSGIDIKAFGNLQIDGNSNMSGNLSVSGKLTSNRFRLPRGTEAQMNALSSPEGGEMFYVTTGSGLGVWEYVDGFGWRIFATRVWASTGVAP